MVWQPRKLTRAQLEERRLAGGRLLKRSKLPQAQIACQLGVSREAVRQWAQQMQAGGMPCLYQRISAGRPARLTPANMSIMHDDHSLVLYQFYQMPRLAKWQIKSG